MDESVTVSVAAPQGKWSLRSAWPVQNRPVDFEEAEDGEMNNGEI
jgi:hypothetical protein